MNESRDEMKTNSITYIDHMQEIQKGCELVLLSKWKEEEERETREGEGERKLVEGKERESFLGVWS